ncbi:hypothetical protein [Paenibacillus sp. GYB003]|uniref:hypothetical protein n=1 Tax=Paenibacillus sp. GYB003 TaxID=2994392 RepID=UPI002F96562E
MSAGRRGGKPRNGYACRRSAADRRLPHCAERGTDDRNAALLVRDLERLEREMTSLVLNYIGRKAPV